MTRVLLLSPSSKPGGAERAFAGLARHLPAYGFDPIVALLENGPLEDWLECDRCVIPAGRTRQLTKTVRTVARLRRLAKEQDARAVISNMSKGHFYGGLAALGARLPAIWWQQDIPRRTRVEIAAATVPASRVIVSSDEAARAQNHLSRAGSITKIPLGSPIAEIQARCGSGASIRRMLGWDEHPIVAIVGRLQPWKGQRVFLEAAALLAKVRPDVRYLVVGGAILGWEGSYPDQLRRFAEERGIGELVHFAGHQSDVIPWFDASDVVANASFGEPFGLVLVEAMALGKPVIATAQAGPTEIVEEGRSGLLVSPGEPEELAAALRRVLAEPGLAADLADGARRRAWRFSEDRMAEAFAGVLRATESQGNGRRRPVLLRSEPLEEEEQQHHEERVLPGETNYPEHLARYVRTAVSMRPNISVLDAGCGAGYGSALLAGDGRAVTAVDSSPAAISFATKHYGEDARFVVGDVLALPFDDASFDAITCFEVIEHVESPEALITELARVLRPGGTLFLSTPHALMEQLHEKATAAPHYRYHVSPLTPRQLRRVLRPQFGRIRLYGQSLDLGALHLVLKSVDVLGLRLRVTTKRQAAMRRTLGTPSVEEEQRFRFSRMLSRSATMLFVEAIK